MYSINTRKLFGFMFLFCLLLAILGCEYASILAPAQTLTPPATSTALPVSTNTPFIPKAILKIAVHAPMTGDWEKYGTGLFHAGELAVAQLSLPLESMGYDVELVSYDDAGDLDTAVKNAKTLIKDKDILCGVGHFNSRLTVQASEIYHQAGLAFIAPSATSSTVTDRGYPEVNRVIGRDDAQGMASARFARERGFKAVYVLYNKSTYGRKNADYFKREAAQLGLTISGELATDIPNNFEAVFKPIFQANTDLVYFVGSSEQVGNFINEARIAGYEGVILGTDLIASDVLDFAGPFATDGGGLYYTTIGAPPTSLPGAAQFVKDFQSQFGAEPRMFASYAYDATGICMKAIEEAAKSKGGEIPTRAEVANAIRALVDYQGIMGTYNFNKRGDPTISIYQVVQVISIDRNKWGANPIVASYEVAPPDN